MTDAAQPNAAGSEPATPDELRADIEQARADLAESVDALSDKLDVKGQATATVSDATHRAGAPASHVKQSAPEPVRRGVDSVGAKTGPVIARVSQQAAPHRGKIAAGAAAGLLIAVIVRRRRGRTGRT